MRLGEGAGRLDADPATRRAVQHSISVNECHQRTRVVISSVVSSSHVPIVVNVVAGRLDCHSTAVSVVVAWKDLVLGPLLPHHTELDRVPVVTGLNTCE